MMQCFREIADHSSKFQQQGVVEHLSILEALAAQIRREGGRRDVAPH